MTPERERRVSDLFAAALQRAPCEVVAWLQAVCPDDAEVAAAVLRLINADGRAVEEQFLAPLPHAESLLNATLHWCDAHLVRADGSTESMILGTAVGGAGFGRGTAIDHETTSADGGVGRPETLQRCLGGFERLERVGEGFFGIVYRAWDPNRQCSVALKVMRDGGPANKVDRERFEREFHVMSGLDHPSVVQVYNLGEFEGRPYIAMEFIEGTNLASKLEGPGFSPEETARLLAESAEAVDYVHRHGVIHRDLKPSNILIDAEGRPHVTDFGLAKLEAGHPTLTLTHQFLGTPAYCSPEQAGYKAREVDHRTDVYSLGVVLYEMLTGVLPFQGVTRLLLLQILEDDPKPPRRLNNDLPRDLETICLAALAKEPSRRYPTAGALAEDLRLFLDGKPIVRQPDGVVTKLKIWARRNPRVAALSVAVYLLLVVVAVVPTHLFWRTRELILEADQRVVRHYQDNGARLAEEGNISAALAWFHAAKERDLADPDRERLHRVRLGAFLREGPRPTHVWRLKLPVEAVAISPEGRRALLVTADEGRLVDLQSGVVEPLTAPLSSKLEPGRHKAPNCIGFNRDGTRALAAFGNQVFVWDVSTRPARPVFHVEHQAVVSACAFSPDGSEVATAAGKLAFVRDARTGAAARELTHPELVNHVAFSPDGRALVVSWGGQPSIVGEAWVWDIQASSKNPRVRLGHGDDVFQAVHHPNGRAILTVSYDRTSKLWNAATGRMSEQRQHPQQVTQCAFSRDGRRSLTVNGNETRVCDERTRASLVLKHEGSVTYSAFSPDGGRVVTCGVDQTARVWDSATGAPVRPPLIHHARVNMAAFSPDGRTLVTASDDQVARAWDLAAGFRPTASFRHGSRTDWVALSPDGGRLLTMSWGGDCRLWDARTAARTAPALRQEGPVRDGGFSPDGRLVVTVDGRGAARIWNAVDGRRLATLAADGRYDTRSNQPTHAVFDREGTHVLTFGWRDARLREWRTGRTVAEFSHEGALINYAAFSPDGRLVVTAGNDGAVRLWTRDGRALPTAQSWRHDGAVSFVTFSPDGRRVVTTGLDARAKVWDVASGALVATLPHDQAVRHADFSPDGRRVATASDDRTTRIWDAATGKALTPMLRHAHQVVRVAFSPDGRLLATGSGEGLVGSHGEARVWDAETGDFLTPPLVHGNVVRSLVFTPDSRTLITASFRDPAARAWSVAPASVLAPALNRLVERAAGARVDQVGGLRPIPAEEPPTGETLADGPRVYRPAARDVLDWHESEARDAVVAKNWSAAVPHYDALIDASPTDETFPVLRARARLELNDRAGARADLLSAVRLGSDDYRAWYAAALLTVSAGDRNGYRALCDDLWKRFGSLPIERYQDALTTLCTLGDGATADPDRVVTLAETLLKNARDSVANYYLASLGAALYRAGRDDEAVERLRQSVSAHTTDGTVDVWLYLALSQRRLGRDADAREWMTKVDELSRGVRPSPVNDPVWGALDAILIETLRAEYERPF